MAIIVLVLWFADWLLVRRASLTAKSRLPGQVVMMLLSAIALISIVLALPVSESTRSDLLGLLGLVLTVGLLPYPRPLLCPIPWLD